MHGLVSVKPCANFNLLISYMQSQQTLKVMAVEEILPNKTLLV